MRTLYLKIFVWFWLAMVLVGSVFVISAATLMRQDVSDEWRPMIGGSLAMMANRAIEVYEREGGEALGEVLQSSERHNRSTQLLFNDELEELAGRDVPDEASDLVSRAFETDETIFAQLQRRQFAARFVEGPTGSRYVIMSQMPRGRPGRRPPRTLGSYFFWLDEPREVLILLFAVAATSGVVCYGLARYLVAPVQKLREATRSFSGGDLAVRVGPAVGKRHDELSDLANDFDFMAERVGLLVTTQQQLLSDISHELRSPLARLNVALGLARQRAGDGANDALDRIEREAERLNELIGQLLVLARLEEGPSAHESAAVNLKRVVDEIVADADYEARSRKRSVVVTASEPITLDGNEWLLRSAIENVVRNAVRYTEKGTQVEVSIERRDAGGGQAISVVRVQDHGPGVPPEALEDLFRPFYRVADARERKTGGTGLGLAISERAVRWHGGSLAAENAADGGFVVEVRLPIGE
jgi:two-component system sensor histidine kinase CpxA